MSPSLESIVDRQIQRWNLEMRLARERGGGPRRARPLITISRTLGSGGSLIANLLSDRLDLQVFGREIIDQIAQQSEVRRELVEALDEQARSRVESWVDGLLRRRIFDEGDYYHHLLQVVRSLAEMGSAIIVGRGANYVLRRRLTLNVRIVAPEAARVQRLIEYLKISENEAREEIRKSDSTRSRFIRRLFDRDWENALDYDLVLNTDEICIECAAMIIESTWKYRIEHSPENETAR